MAMHKHGSYKPEHHGGPMAGHVAGSSNAGPGSSKGAAAHLNQMHPSGTAGMGVPKTPMTQGSDPKVSDPNEGV